MKDTLERLRKTILQLAVSGKLVPQDPSEGTGEELYQQIQTEKVCLIKEGKLKNQKDIPPILEDEIPFEIPETWKWVRLGSLLTIERGGSPRPIKDYITISDDGLNWIKIGDTIPGEKYILGTKEKIRVEGMKKTRKVFPGDLLLSNSMSFGRPYILKIEGCIHDGWLLLRDDAKKLSIDFLQILLSAQFSKTQFTNKAAGGVVLNLNSEKVRQVLASLPPLAEQKRIVKKVDQLMQLVDSLEKDSEAAKALLNRLDKTVLHLAVSGQLVPQNPAEGTGEELSKQIQAEKARLIKEGKLKKQKDLPPIRGDEIPFEIPETWKWVKLGEITNYGLTEKIKPNEIKGTTWVLELEDIEKDTSRIINRLTYSERQSASDKNVFRKGDILYGKLRPYLNKIVIPNEDGIASSEILPLRVYGSLAKHTYIMMAMKSEHFLSIVSDIAYGMKMPRLGTEDGRKQMIPFPPVAEQKRIVKKVEQISLQITSLRLLLNEEN